ncbi:MAG: DUF1192 domain-containing protein [Rhodomicrobium sp.]|nr:DUF1192 domain-containing protein [Rhodomicrobium sp.]
MDEEAPKKRSRFELGADLSRFSEDDLREYMGLLDAERRRAEAMLSSKQQSRNAADSVFKSR